MRRILAAALLLLGLAPAAAQNLPNTVPDHTVMGRVGTGSGSGPLQAVPFTLFLNILLSGPATWLDTLTIAPPSGTVHQGLVTNSTAPAAPGSQANTFNFNEINATNPGYVNTGNTFDSNYLLPAINGLKITLQSGGTNGATIPAALTALAHANALTNPNLVGGILAGTSNQASTASAASGDAIWGGLGYSNLGPSGSALVTFGLDGESGAATGSTIYNRFGVGASSYGPNQGIISDSAFAVLQTPLNQSGGWSTSAPFVSALNLFTGYGTTFLSPLASTGSVITSTGANSGTFTTANFVNLPNVTFTGNLFNLHNFVVTGAGSGTITGPSGNNIWTATVSSGGQVSLAASQNGTTGFDALQVTDVSTNNNLFSGLWEASNTGTIFGETKGNYAGLFAYGSANLGLLLGTVSSTSVIFGTANVKAGGIDSTQRWYLGSAFFTPVGSGTLLTVTRNAATTLPAAGFTSGEITANIVGVDGTTSRLLMVAAGTSKFNAINYAQSRGTVASPTATQSGDFLAANFAVGYGTSYQTNGGGGFVVSATENFDGTHGGSQVAIYGTPNGSTSAAVVATYQAGVQIGSPTGGDEGAGKINVQNGYYINGAAGLTQTCTVNQAKTLIFTLGILTGGTCNS